MNHLAKAAKAANPSARSQRGVIGYREIATRLLEDIHRGAWQIGQLLPTEKELETRFDVSRHTIREGLRQLEILGYIRRRRGARSTLVATDVSEHFVNSIRSVDEMIRYADFASSTVLATDDVILNEELAARLECKPGSKWVRISLIRSIGRGRPLSYSEIYIEPRYRDIIPEIEQRKKVYTLIQERHGVLIRLVEQVIGADCANANLGSRLRVAVGSALLVVRTKFHGSDGRVVELGLTHFPADRYQIRMSLERRRP